MKTSSGRTAARVARASAPAAVSPAAACACGCDDSGLKLQRILVPIDFSPGSIKALRYARKLADSFGASLCLVHVIETAAFIDGVNEIPIVVPEGMRGEDAKAHLIKLARKEIPSDLPVSPAVRIGTPFQEIADEAKMREADLIVIATHGYTGLKHLFLGSTTEKVVRHAPCPVLVVRERERDFVETAADKAARGKTTRNPDPMNI